MVPPLDLAAVRRANTLRLFDEFVAATVQHPDAATLRGLERRFAERLRILPSYWSQIKGGSRQVGERLARQFEQCTRKPAGWLDTPHDADAAPPPGAAPTDAPSSLPRDDDERFIVGLVLTYYRRHPARARTRLLDLLGEVLVPAPDAAPAAPRGPEPVTPAAQRAAPAGRGVPGTAARAPTPPVDADERAWSDAQRGVEPLKRRPTR